MTLNFDELNSNLATKIKDESLNFVLEVLKKKGGDGIDTSLLINLLLSSHISSLFNCMKALSDGNEEISEQVSEFMKKTADFMRDNVPVQNKVYPY